LACAIGLVTTSMILIGRMLVVAVDLWRQAEDGACEGGLPPAWTPERSAVPVSVRHGS
jgi:hypothetical protein